GPLAVRQQLAQIGAKVDGDAVGEGRAALHADAERLSNRAVAAVGSQQILRPDGECRPCLAITQLGHDVLSQLVDRNDFWGDPRPRSDPHAPWRDQRLQSILRKKAPPKRTDIPDTRIQTPYKFGCRAAKQSPPRDAPAVLNELLFGAPADRRFDS